MPAEAPAESKWGSWVVALVVLAGMTTLLLNQSFGSNSTTEGYQLGQAASVGDAAAVRASLQRGAVVDEPDLTGNTPLLYAAAGGHQSAVDELLSAGASPNHLNAGGTPAIVAAARSAPAEIVRSLLDHGATPDARTPRGMTAIMIAATGANEETIRTLVDAGADASARDDEGQTALWYAAGAEEPGQVLDLLLKLGIDVKVTDTHGRTALHEAAERGTTGSYETLVRAGANPNAVDHHGLTPAAILAERRRNEAADAARCGDARALNDHAPGFRVAP